MEKLLLQQYKLVVDSRKIIIDFCANIKPEDLLKEVGNFGRGNIRDLYVHVENSYYFWIKDFVFQKDISYTKAEEIINIEDIRKIFEKTDLMVLEFIERYRDRYEELITNILNNKEITVSPFKIFTHIITHEYHHKGQILSMCRHLGYIPIETGIIH